MYFCSKDRNEPHTLFIQKNVCISVCDSLQWWFWINKVEFNFFFFVPTEKHQHTLKPAAVMFPANAPNIINFDSEVLFSHVCLLFGWFVSGITSKNYRTDLRMSLGPERTPSAFVVDLDKETTEDHFSGNPASWILITSHVIEEAGIYEWVQHLSCVFLYLLALISLFLSPPTAEVNI